MSFFHYSRVVWYQLVKPRLWQWSTALVQPVPTEAAFRSLFPFKSTSDNQFLQSFRKAVAPRLLFDAATSRSELCDRLVSVMDKEEILRQAHDALENRFAVFSDTPFEFGPTIDWHRDYKSGHSWPAGPYHRIDFMAGGGNDMKFPCEVSKFHRLSWLGMAHLLTNDERYAVKFALETTDWIQNNPVNVGINWTVPLEVAIRAVNWIQAYSFFHAASLPDSFTMLFLRSLYAHGLFLEYNLEYVRVPGNHFACNCLGLVALGSFFGDTRAGRRWFAMGKKFLEQEILRQNTPDGVNFEKSIPYHRFVTEIYTLALAFAEKTAPFSPEYRARLEVMYSYMAAYLRPDGSAPMIGDADNGRILRFRAHEDFNDQRDNLAVGAALFGSSDFAAGAPAPSPDVLFTLGSEAVRAYPKAAPADDGYGQYYPDGGYIIHRSAHHHFILDCGDYGKQGRGGHGHNDCLSFELWVNGCLLVGDSGTGVYTSDSALRDKLRSTRAHNTVVYAGKEQVEYAGVWQIQEDGTAPAVLDLDADETGLHLVVEHYGYAARTGAIHRRSVLLRTFGAQGKLVISDEIIGADPLGGTSFYHFPPGVTIAQTDEDTCLQGTCGNTAFTVRSDTPSAIAQAPYSPLYGVVGECTEVCFPCNNTITLTW